MKSIQVCYVSALAVAVAVSAPAHAQTVDADSDASGASDAPSEIVVTATKRSESLTDVPIAVQVFTDQAIAERGITRPADFLSATPNVTFIEDNAGEAYINIRGQTSVRNSDPNVAIVIDGVTLSSVKPFNQDLFAIEQIEVLKGPQSALYGRNAAAGAIVINTKKPSNILEGGIVGAVGNWNTYRVSANLAGPVSDTLGFAIAGSFRDTDGPFTNIVTGEKVHRSRNYAGRGRLLFDNQQGLTIDLKVGGHDSKGGGSAYNAQIAGTGIGGLPADPPVLDANFAEQDFISNVRGEFEENFWDATLKIDYETDFATFTSISSYNRLDQYFGSDSPPYVPDTGAAGATIQQYTYLDKNYSQEIRMTSPSDQRLRWQAGFYYLRFTRNQTSNIMVDADGTLPDNPRMLRLATDTYPSLSYSNPLYKTTSYAPFASVEFDITDALELRLAGRYDTEERSIRENASPDINPLTGASYNNCVALTGLSFEDCTDSRTFKQFEPKASLTYEISPEASLYASYGKGFKSGGFNPIGAREALRAAAGGAGLDPDSVYVQDLYNKEVSESYELGLKTQLFNRRLSFNMAVFQTDISGAQQFEFYPTVGLQTTISIDKVRVRGIDADFNLRLPTGTNIYGGAGYIDGEIKQFDGNPAFVGNVAPGAFEYTISLGVSQEIAITDGIELVPRVEYNRYGPIWWDVANTPGTRRDPLDLVKARLSLRSDSGWEVSAFADNITNEKYFQEVVPLLGFFTVNYRGPTRSYGVEARYSF